MKGLLYAAAWFLTILSAIYWIAQIVDPITGAHGPPIWLVAAFTSGTGCGGLLCREALALTQDWARTELHAHL